MINKKSKTAGKTSFFLKIIFIINIIFALSLILSYLAAYISPDKYWIIAFFGITYPILFLINFLFVILWLFFKRKYALIFSIVIIAGIGNLFKMVQSSKKVDISELKNALKVISFNARNFDIYNYGKNWTYTYENRDKIFNFLTKEQPDILCFQEYVHDTTGKFKTGDTLKEFLNAKNQHLYFTSNSRKINYFGIATMTKFPILDTGSILFTTVSGNICIYTDVLINFDTVRIYNVHLESIRMKSEDYLFAEQLSKDIDKDIGIKQNSERIIGRMKKAFIIRAAQARQVADHISKCPYKIILCGDFNDTPTSYAYHTIASSLIDSFVESGNGLGQSYVGVFPSFRIDYIMHSKGIRSYNFETVEEEMSDHYPVKCYLKIEKK